MSDIVSGFQFGKPIDKHEKEKKRFDEDWEEFARSIHKVTHPCIGISTEQGKEYVKKVIYEAMKLNTADYMYRTLQVYESDSEKFKNLCKSVFSLQTPYPNIDRIPHREFAKIDDKMHADVDDDMYWKEKAKHN